MKYLLLAFISMALNTYAADAPVCKKCQVIRDYNAAHPENNYYWYDDYLNEKGLDKNGEKADSSSKKEESLLSGCKKCKDKDRETVRPYDLFFV